MTDTDSAPEPESVVDSDDAGSNDAADTASRADTASAPDSVGVADSVGGNALTATPTAEDAAPPPAPPAAPLSPAQRGPDRRIALLLVVALVVTGLFVGWIWLTQPPGHGTVVPDTIAKGQPVPNIAGTSLEGSPVDLTQFRGHPVVVNFWASWCVPCQQEMPLLAQKAAAHAASGLVILGVLSDDTVSSGQAFEKQYGATWPTVFDATGSIKTAYRVLGRPQSYFVDKDGILRSIQIGYLTDADFERQFTMIAGGS